MHIVNTDAVALDSYGVDHDVWSEWLLKRRHGGNAEYAAQMREALVAIRDRVLDGAALADGMTLLDVGTGDGLIGFGAIALIGPSLRVIMTDVSRALLRECRHHAERAGVIGQCSFHEGSAERLDGIESESVDAVTCRAVLAYVSDKAAAIREFHRVLGPGGRMSIAEPIVQDEALELIAMTDALAHGQNDNDGQFTRLLHRWKSAQFPATAAALHANSLTNYNERSLVYWARAAGFTEIHLELHVDVAAATFTNWDLFIDIAPHPSAPTIREILTQDFSSSERADFEAVMRPLVEAGRWTDVSRAAYMVAVKPK